MSNWDKIKIRYFKKSLWSPNRNAHNFISFHYLNTVAQWEPTYGMIKINDFFSANHSLNVQLVILIIFKNIPFTTLFHRNPKGNLASDGISSYTDNSWNYFSTRVWDNIKKYFILPQIGINLLYRETLGDIFFSAKLDFLHLYFI